jgi:fermentation-respiration switch protein FrsA (DUF1100 family)
LCQAGVAALLILTPSRMTVLKFIAITIIILYLAGVMLLYFFQTRLIFHPGKLSIDHKFRTVPPRTEVFLKTHDGVTINGLFFPGEDKSKVILYFHGNAGDLSGWQFAAEDLLPSGFSVFIIDYRGYGKSSGSISEGGFYSDAEAAYNFLIRERKLKPDSILIYGRSIGTGVAIDLASKKKCGGLILESAYTSLSTLANEKVPFFFPSLYLKTKFNNRKKLERLKVPVVFFHGTDDTLIPPSHSKVLYDSYNGKKSFLLIENGQHNDLPESPEYKNFVADTMPSFFYAAQRFRLNDN